MRVSGNRAFVSLSAAFALAASCIFADPAKPLLDVSAASPAFETLRRLQTRSGISMPGQAFPQTAGTMESWLAGIPLTGSDSARLLFHLPGRRREAWNWFDSVRNHSIFISPAVDMAWRSESRPDSNDASRLGGLGGTIYGRLGPRISFYSRAMVYTEFTDKPQFTHQFNPEFGETYSVEKGAGDSLLKDRTFNRFESYVLAGLPWGITLKAGRDRVHTGPGYFSSLMATRDTPPYWLAEARVDFAPWLSLHNYLLRMTDTRHDIDKFANLHRFEFRPFRGLGLAFQDIAIYQDRDPDWRYALPLAPLTFIESDMGGRDNSAMGFDFLYAGLPGFSVWGELFIDDLMGPTSFFDDFWENRWAGLAGFQIASPFPRFDADLVVEYGHVEPWTYNGRKPQTSFKHFNVPSASKLGPDSRSLDVQAAYRPLAWLELKERIEVNDKGVGRQATLGVIHDDSLDGTTKNHLGDEVTEERFLHHSIGAIWRSHLWADAYWIQGLGDNHYNRFGFSLLARW